MRPISKKKKGVGDIVEFIMGEVDLSSLQVSLPSLWNFPWITSIFRATVLSRADTKEDRILKILPPVPIIHSFPLEEREGEREGEGGREGERVGE